VKHSTSRVGSASFTLTKCWPSMPARPWIVVLVRPQFFNRDGVREAGSGRYLKSVIISECRLLRRLALPFLSLKILLCSEGLEPQFRVLFSAIFQGVSLGNCHQCRKWRILAEAKLLQTAASLRTFCWWVIFNQIAHTVSLRSWSRSPVIMEPRKSRSIVSRSA
jgi:hypothetical protein